jgi:ribosome biogenesis SPOUT family RNA methylase Rps3
MKQYNVDLERVCLLDPRAEREISPEDGDGRFEWFLFGVRIMFHIFDITAYTCLIIQGILGNRIS